MLKFLLPDNQPFCSSEDRKKFKYSWSEGVANYNNKNYEFAIDSFSKLIEHPFYKVEVDSIYMSSLYMRGLSFFEFGKYKKAIKDFDSFVYKVNPIYVSRYDLSCNEFAMNNASAYYYRFRSMTNMNKEYSHHSREKLMKYIDKAIKLEEDPNFKYIYLDAKCSYLEESCLRRMSFGDENEYNDDLNSIKKICNNNDFPFTKFKYLDEISKNFREYHIENNFYQNLDGSSKTGEYDEDGIPCKTLDMDKLTYVSQGGQLQGGTTDAQGNQIDRFGEEQPYVTYKLKKRKRSSRTFL